MEEDSHREREEYYYSCEMEEDHVEKEEDEILDVDERKVAENGLPIYSEETIVPDIIEKDRTGYCKAVKVLYQFTYGTHALNAKSMHQFVCKLWKEQDVSEAEAKLAVTCYKYNLSREAG